eukprot:3647509-Prymnesium_polylepis.1
MVSGKSDGHEREAASALLHGRRPLADEQVRASAPPGEESPPVTEADGRQERTEAAAGHAHGPRPRIRMASASTCTSRATAARGT